MDEAIIKQIFDELLASLEPLEAQSTALLQFVKDQGIATDEQLAPYLEQAGNISNIRWRAARVRTAALISSALKPAQKSEAPAELKNAQSTDEPSAETDKETEKDPDEATGKAEEAEKENSKQEAPQPDLRQKEPQQKEPPQKEPPHKDEKAEKKEAA
jgi:hypothetical protein